MLQYSDRLMMCDRLVHVCAAVAAAAACQRTHHS